MMDESSSDDCDVVVIGGGLSGLVAARTLIQHDNSLRVILLEASHRLGGRVESIKCPVSNIFIKGVLILFEHIIERQQRKKV